ncbi:hypothetical protein ACQCN7_21660 [Escherichia coli]
MNVSPDEEASEKSSVLSAALKASNTAVKSVIALNWRNDRLNHNELPPELLKNRHHVAIYLMPKTFMNLNRPMASEFAELWQFGKSRTHQVEKAGSNPQKPLSICHFKLSEFGSSATVKTAVSSILEKSIATLPQMAGVETGFDERWDALRSVATEIAQQNVKTDSWSVPTPSFEATLEYPLMFLEKRAIGTDTYVVNGESPLSSDAYGAIGAFAARAYFEAVLSKKTGDDRLFVKPTRVGVRIWDDYDFNDSSDLMKALSFVFGKYASQFLGFWNEEKSGEAIILQNHDFRTFREQFMPVYNSQIPAPVRPMVCQDFSPVSEFAIRTIEGGAEYPLAGFRLSMLGKV